MHSVKTNQLNIEVHQVQRMLVREIAIGDWISYANEHATTISKQYRPESAAIACSYETKAACFIDSATYLVRFTDSTGTKLVAFDYPKAKSITIRQFAERPDFVSTVLDGWFDPTRGEIQTAELITMHCLGCDGRLVIDGVHRITRIASNKTPGAIVRVTEISALKWPRPMPDMEVVRDCARR